MENLSKERSGQSHKDPKNWKWGLIYYNPEDPRNMVPKKWDWMGMTINFARPKAVIFLIASLAFATFIVSIINSKN